MEATEMDTNAKPEAKSEEAQKRYAQLCAQIGERHYLASKLASEVTKLMKEIDELKASIEEKTQ